MSVFKGDCAYTHTGLVFCVLRITGNKDCKAPFTETSKVGIHLKGLQNCTQALKEQVLEDPWKNRIVEEEEKIILNCLDPTGLL